MKRRIELIRILILAVAVGIALDGCKKDEKVTFTLSTLVAQSDSGPIDLNGAFAANTVPVLPTITATFNLAVDPATVTSSTIFLLREWDQRTIPLTVTTTGPTVTVVPGEELGNGALFTLTFPAVRSTDGQTYPAFVRTFTTIGTFVPTGQVAFWNFENNTNDQVGTFNADSVINITYTPSLNTLAGMAATFDGTTSIIEIPGGDLLTNTPELTLGFWFKTNSTGHVDAGGNPKGHFVIGLGAFYGFQFEIQGSYAECKLGASYDVGPPLTNPHDLVFNGDGKDKDNGGWKACTFSKLLTPTPAEGMVALIKDKWVYATFVFHGPTKVATLYMNGEKMKEENFDLADPTLNDAIGMAWAGSPPEVFPRLAFGFVKSRQGTLWATQPWGGYQYPTSNHFGGQLDNVRIFHRALSATEIGLMYNSEKP